MLIHTCTLVTVPPEEEKSQKHRTHTHQLNLYDAVQLLRL